MCTYKVKHREPYQFLLWIRLKHSNYVAEVGFLLSVVKIDTPSGPSTCIFCMLCDFLAQIVLGASWAEPWSSIILEMSCLFVSLQKECLPGGIQESAYVSVCLSVHLSVNKYW